MCESRPAYQVDSSLAGESIDLVLATMSESTKDDLLRRVLSDAIDNGGDTSSPDHIVAALDQAERNIDQIPFALVDTEAIRLVGVVAAHACNLTMGPGGDDAQISRLVYHTVSNKTFSEHIR